MSTSVFGELISWSSLWSYTVTTQAQVIILHTAYCWSSTLSTWTSGFCFRSPEPESLHLFYQFYTFFYTVHFNYLTSEFSLRPLEIRIKSFLMSERGSGVTTVQTCKLKMVIILTTLLSIKQLKFTCIWFNSIYFINSLLSSSRLVI